MCESQTRRAFLGEAGSCAAHLALAAMLAPRALHAAVRWRGTGAIVAREPWGRLEQVASGVWALISDPFGGDRTTLANGAIVSGTRGVLVVEGLFTPAGAAWMAAQAKSLTGRWPTHALLTHHHSDHVDGVAGYRRPDGPTPRVIATPATLATARWRARTNADLAAMLADVERLDDAHAGRLDLGGVAVSFDRRSGHTASDVAVIHHDAKVVIGGDLLWNGIFPNFVDAVPSEITQSVRGLRRDASWRYVPGHGAVMTDRDVAGYQAMLDALEDAARTAYDRGDTEKAAAAAWSVPASLGAWKLFGPAFIGRAFTAWYQELDGY